MNTTTGGVVVRDLLPYGEAFLFVDRVIRNDDDSIITEKTFLPGHEMVDAHLIDGPRYVPGVLLIEMVGQSSLLLERLSSRPSATYGLLGRCSARFISPAVVGCVARAFVRLSGAAAGGRSYEGEITVDDKIVAVISVLAVSSGE